MRNLCNNCGSQWCRFGGGFELALSLIYLCFEHGSFCVARGKLGIMPGAMGTQHLPAAAGLRRAKELVLTGRAITAQQAHDWQIINAIFLRRHC